MSNGVARGTALCKRATWWRHSGYRRSAHTTILKEAFFVLITLYQGDLGDERGLEASIGRLMAIKKVPIQNHLPLWFEGVTVITNLFLSGHHYWCRYIEIKIRFFWAWTNENASKFDGTKLRPFHHVGGYCCWSIVIQLVFCMSRK